MSGGTARIGEKGTWVVPVSSGPDSSSDDGECARRADGSLSPGAVVRLGGGGSLPLPRNLRSLEDVRSVGNAPIFMLWRVVREGGIQSQGYLQVLCAARGGEEER